MGASLTHLTHFPPSASSIHLLIRSSRTVTQNPTMSVLSVSLSQSHAFSKPPIPSITLIKDQGVEGDCHNGHTIQHQSRLHIQPPPVNLRQVHLMPNEILVDLAVKPGDVGENITTTGIDLLGLASGTRVHFLPASRLLESGVPGPHGPQAHAIVRITGLRNPCPQIEKFQSGLQERFIVRDEERKIVHRKAGVMGVVEVGGTVEPGMLLKVEEPLQFEPLECV
jgi:MOSC domain-containing protein YiiM